MACLNPYRAGDFLAVQLQFDNVFTFDLQALRHLGADEHGIVPGELGHRLGQFLQPAVVGELSVVDGGIAADVELDGVGGCGDRIWRWEICGLRGYGFRSVGRAFDPAIVQRLAPELLEVCAGVLFLPIGAQQIVTGRIRLAGEQRHEFQRALAAVEGRNQRLNDADRSIVSAGVAPGFEFVRLIDVPLTKFCGFVLIKPEMNAKRNLAVLQDVGEIEIGGRIVGRIAAENDQ